MVNGPDFSVVTPRNKLTLAGLDLMFSNTCCLFNTSLRHEHINSIVLIFHVENIAFSDQACLS